jgi:GNAT superfamily N-acetyltransferase
VCYHSRVGVKPAVRLRDLAEEYTALLRSAFGDRLVAVLLHGPVARGEVGACCDVDLLVVVDPIAHGRPFGRRELLAAADEAIAPLLVAADMDGIPARLARVVCARTEAHALVSVDVDLVEDAIVLWDRDGFVVRLLADARATLFAVGARRVRAEGASYWALGDEPAQPVGPTRPADSAIQASAATTSASAAGSVSASAASPITGGPARNPT